MPASEIEIVLNSISREQHSDGLWSDEALTRTAKETSRFTTTALIVELLYAHLRNSQKTHLAVRQRERQTITRLAKRLFSGYEEPLRSSALRMVDHICSSDRTFEITLLPHLFSQALRTTSTVTNRQRIILSLANVSAWIAYTIYDDFLDDEGQPANLPVANIALRISLNCFRAVLPEQNSFHTYIEEVFTIMDQANAWEVSNCRFNVRGDIITITELPRYRDGRVLSERSFVYILVALAILGQQTARQPKQVQSIVSGFQHYLIARQLNDDMHDWLEDMQNGHASYVVTAILRDMRTGPGVYSLAELLPLMQRDFRQTTLPKVCQRILLNIKRSRQSFAKSHLLRSENDIYVLLDTIEMSVRQSLDKYAKTRALTNIVL